MALSEEHKDRFNKRFTPAQRVAASEFESVEDYLSRGGAIEVVPSSYKELVVTQTASPTPTFVKER